MTSADDSSRNKTRSVATGAPPDDDDARTKKERIPVPSSSSGVGSARRTLWYKIRRHLKNDIEFKWLIFVQLLCGVYILVVTFTYSGTLGIFGGAVDPQTGTIIDPASPENTERGIIQVTNFGHTFDRAVVAATTGQMVLLGISRFADFSMYPAIVCVFWSKYRALQAFLYKTPFNIFLFTDTHRLHRYCGWVILVNGTIHAACHLGRWGIQGNLYLLFGQYSGVTGFISLLCVLVIVIPMTCLLKRKIAFEARKYAHYLFWPFCIAMTFHAKLWVLPTGGYCAFVFPALIGVYALDAFYVKTCMTEKVVTVRYTTLPSGVQLTMPVSDRFQKAHAFGGYGYVMFEWVDRMQWHAFSIYEGVAVMPAPSLSASLSPSDVVRAVPPQHQPPQTTPSCRHIFIARAGDWTNRVYSKMDRNTVRPVWISGPFPSPYNNADYFDNMVLVAAGIGITPALSTIEAYRDSRRMNLIWTVRDASMLTFFLTNAKLDHKGFNLVFYTGKDPLPDTIENFNTNANLTIINERPDLSRVIPNIIKYVDLHGHSQHERDLPDKARLAMALVKERAEELLQRGVEGGGHDGGSGDGVVRADVVVGKLATYAAELGYSMRDLLEHADHRGDGGSGRLHSSSPSPNNGSRGQPGDSRSKLLLLPVSAAQPYSRMSSRRGEVCGMDEARGIFPFDERGDDWTGLLDDDELAGKSESGAGGAVGGGIPPHLSPEAILDMIGSIRDTPAAVLGSCLEPPPAAQVGSGSFDSLADPHHPHSIWHTNGLSSSHLHRRHSNDNNDDHQPMDPPSPETTSSSGAGPFDSGIRGIWEEDPEARPYVHAMPTDHLETWGLLYCGGRNTLLEALVKESKDLNIPLHEEAFDW